MCSNYRGITLLSIAGKVLTTIIQQRILSTIEHVTDEQQAGFKPGRGCVDQIFNLKQVQERRVKYEKDYVTVFVDFSAAFDSVHRKSLWNALLSNGLPGKIVNILRSLYDNANSHVRSEGCLSNPFKITTGVRQGCVISPKLFNVIVNWVAGKSRSPGVQVGVDYWLSYLAYADDLAIIAENDVHAQAALNALQEAASRLGLKINTQKTKVFGAENICHDGAPVECVENFTYLGAKITSGTINVTEEVATRIGKAAATFARLRPTVWSSDNVSIQTKMRIYRSVIVPVLLYASETWRLLGKDVDRLEVFQMQCLREISGVSMRDRLRNEDIRRKCHEQPPVKELIRSSRLRWFGHVCRMPPERDPRKLVRTPIPKDWKCPPTAPKALWLGHVKKRPRPPETRLQGFQLVRQEQQVARHNDGPGARPTTMAADLFKGWGTGKTQRKTATLTTAKSNGAWIK